MHSAPAHYVDTKRSEDKMLGDESGFEILECESLKDDRQAKRRRSRVPNEKGSNSYTRPGTPTLTTR